MTIHIEALSFDVIIGLLDFERVTPQGVIIDIELLYDYSNDNFINYATIAQIIEFHLNQKKYKLLENALIGLKDIIQTTYPQTKTLKIKINKPNIMSNCSVGLSCFWELSV